MSRDPTPEQGSTLAPWASVSCRWRISESISGFSFFLSFFPERENAHVCAGGGGRGDMGEEEGQRERETALENPK